MSKLSQLRKKMGYETNVPRCETCASYKKPYIFLSTNSIPKRSPAFCRTADFTVQPNACCDKWVGNDGTELRKEVVASRLCLEVPVKEQ
jgi:hypothetical protein